MGIALPQLAPASEDRVSGAQVIDGSLKFDSSKSHYLSRTPSSAGNRKTWTWSGWLKLASFQDTNPFIFGTNNSNAQRSGFLYATNNELQFYSRTSDTTSVNASTLAFYRDYSAWYHIVLVVDTTESSSADVTKIYVNGVLKDVTVSAGTNNYQTEINNTVEHAIGRRLQFADRYIDTQMSQVYFIDGQALGPGYFGYTDPLTNTWRPKKYTGEYGLILNNFTDGLPILNTDSTGTSVVSGTRSDTNASNIVIALPFNGNVSDVSADIRGSGSNDTPTNTGITFVTSDSKYYGTSGYINSSDNVQFNGSQFDATFQSTGTMEWWASIETVNNYLTFWNNNSGGSNRNNISYESGGSYSGLHWRKYATNANMTLMSAASFAALAGTGWHHYALTWSGGTTKFYLDGIETASASFTPIWDTSWKFGGTGDYYVQDFKCYKSVIYSSNFSPAIGGENSFHLPFDGNSPIGEDKSGTGNNWTPVNFGGSVALDKATGALPILNTDGGGNVARVGVFGSEVGAYYAVTVSNPGSGNKYYLDGVLSANPTLTRGATYTFDQSDSSNSGHPLVFGTTAEGNNYSDGVTTSGTPGSAGAFTRITVPHNAPDTLYYHCSVHSGMGSSTSQITDETKADPYAWKNVLALPLVGSKDDVSTQISPVVLNDVTRIRFKTDWNWMYVSAIEINGTILTTGTLDNSGGVWSGGDNWKNGSVGSGQETYSQSARGDWFDVTLASTLKIDNLRIYVYLDASAGSTTNIFELELFYGGGLSYLKALPSNSFAPNGNFNQRSWQDFGSVAFKSVLSTNAIASSASSNFYGGSWYFDGSGDYLSVSSSSDLTFGTGDFTLEYFINTTDTNFNLMHPDSSSGSGYWGHIIQSSSFNWNDAYNSNNLWNVDATPILNGGWHHCAICRASGTTKVFFDGISQPNTAGTFTDNTDYSGVDGWEIGGSGNLGDLSGYLSDLRVYKGVAKYTSNFVVPATSPDILPDTPSGVNGSSKLAKVTDGAVSFDGSGDYLTSAESSDEYDFPSGDWTIEYFAYCNSEPSDAASFSNTKSFSSAYRSMIVEGNSGNLRLLLSTDGSGSWTTVGTTTNDLNKWRHIALVRNSGTISFYVDGISRGSTSSTPYDNANNNTVYFGRNGGDGSGYFSGFISNARIIKGTALYTTDFTPPTRELTNVTNTKLLCCQSNTSAGAAAVSPSLGGINNGTLWSSYISGNVHASLTAQNAFDGDTSTKCVGAGAGDTVTFTSPSTISISSGLRVYFWKNTSGDPWGTFTINGSTVDLNSLGATHGAWYDFGTTYNSSGLTSMSWENDNGGNIDVRVSAIEIDGTVLVDPISPNGNAAATTFNPFTTDINAVRGQESGYATLNPLGPGDLTLSNGNLTYTRGSTDWEAVLGTQSMTAGNNWYFEVFFDIAEASGNGAILEVGIALETFSAHNNYLGTDSNSWTYQNNNGSNGQKGHNNSFSTYGLSLITGDTLGVSLDLSPGGSNGVITFYKNGVSMGYAYNNLDCTINYFPAFSAYASGKGTVNFGQKPFKFPPPDGFQPLNAANVRPSTVIARPDKYVSTVLWTGNSTARSIVTNNAPDFVWTKLRNTGNNHKLFDSVRGVEKRLESSTTNSESTESGSLTAFNSNGFSLGTVGNVNGSYNYVAWCWKAGGSKNTFNVDDVGYASAAAAGLGSGSLAVTGASVGTRQGFSIIKWEGNRANSTVSHGLNSAVKFYFVKNLDQSSDWITWHTGLSGGGQGYIRLNTYGAPGTASTPWNSTIPTNSVFSLGADTETNGNGDDMIAYCWSDVPGLQKFGSFTGNGATDGNFIELGFRPALIWIKGLYSYDGGNTQVTETGWAIYDSTRSPNNPNGDILGINNSYIEENNGSDVDFLSNGFKLRNNRSWNTSSGAIYCAWAEAPTFNLYGGQSNAR